MTSAIVEAVSKTGLDAFAVVRVSAPATLSAYEQFVSAGLPQGLGYLARGIDARRSLDSVMPGTNAVFCALIQLPPAAPGWARFCAVGDYHEIMRNKLGATESILRNSRLIAGNSRICVDSTPIMERELAVRAGLGSITRNHMLVHPNFGAGIVLGELLIENPASSLDCVRKNTIPFRPENLVPGFHCTCAEPACERCCPTGALSHGAYSPSRCLAYLTSQHPGELTPEFAVAIGNTVWGCDRCQARCPTARYRQNDIMPPHLARLTPELILRSSARQLTRSLAGTPMAAAHPRILQRNTCYVLGNTGDSARTPLLRFTAEQNPCDWVRSAADFALRLLHDSPT